MTDMSTGGKAFGSNNLILAFLYASNTKPAQLNRMRA